MTERLFVRLDDDPLYAPETTVPMGAMREFAMPAMLRDHVAQVMAYDEVLPNDRDVIERVLPDGALRLIFDFGGEQPAAWVAGPSAKPAVLRMRGRLHGLSVALRPGAAMTLFGVPTHELAERQTPWADMASTAHRHLAERLREAQDDAARVGMLLEMLQGSMRDATGGERQMAVRATQLLRHPERDRSVRAVAEAVGVGERRLQQVFRRHIGLSPRTWGRLARMHECLRLLRRPAPLPWHQLAIDAGFYDQSHLINEFQSLCGLTLEQFLRRGVSGSSKTAA